MNKYILELALLKLKEERDFGSYCKNYKEHNKELINFPSGDPYCGSGICPICLAEIIKEIRNEQEDKNRYKFR